jgi:hypothetical protein
MVERLDLAFLVNGENECLFRRVEVEADDTAASPRSKLL